MAKIPRLKNRYNTPQTNPATSTCRGYLIPDDENIRGAWNEVVSILENPDVWDDENGGMSAIDTASMMSSVALYEQCVSSGGDMEVIVPNFTLMTAAAYVELQLVDNYDVLELSMTLKTDENGEVDGHAISLNGTTSGYIATKTRIVQSGATAAGIDTTSNGDFDNTVIGDTGLFHSPVLWRLWRGYNAWFGIGHSTLFRSTSLFNHSRQTILWNSGASITTLRVSPVRGSNFAVNCQFMLRGIQA